MPSVQLVHTLPQIWEVLVLVMQRMRIPYLLLLLWALWVLPTDTFGQQPVAETEPSSAVDASTDRRQPALPDTWQKAIREVPKEKSYSKGPNVHRSAIHCDHCHIKGEPATANNLLYEGQDVPLCRTCHPRSVYRVHVVDIRPKKVEVPKEFPLPGGKVTCVTCHDEPSCNPQDSPSWQRPFFLRGKETGFLFCFECHPQMGYEPYNPHDPKHLQDPGERTNNCLFCHLSELPVDSRRGLAYASLKGQPNELCSACHPEEPHFGIPAHLNVKSEKYRDLLAETAEKLGPLLPLGENQQALCVSCHDPHIPGLIPEPKEGPDVWMEPVSSELLKEYREQHLYPFVRERVAELETAHGRTLIIREPGLFHQKPRKLLRKGLQRNGSLCLLCHDVFEEKQEKERRFDYRILY